MALSTRDRVAVVTGSSRGIGRATALRLAADGLSVVVNYHTDAISGKQVAASIQAQGGRAVAQRANAADPAELRALLDVAEQCYGGLDVLVHNAGGFFRGALDNATDEQYRQAFALNAHATFLSLREAGHRMSDGGRIVFISSVVTRLSPPDQALFAASKAAGEQLVRSYAREVGARGITVNNILPGPTDTDGFGASSAPTDTLIARTPLGRLGRPDDIADVVAFLASDAARWITGQSITVDGGLS